MLIFSFSLPTRRFPCENLQLSARIHLDFKNDQKLAN